MSGDMRSGGVAALVDGLVGVAGAVPCGLDTCSVLMLRPRKGQRFHSGACRAAWYDKHHPRVAAPGSGNRKVAIKDRIVAAMADRFWRTTAQLAYELRESEGTVSRKLRGLRAMGFAVESRRTAPSSRSPLEFRLVLTGTST